MTTGVASTTVAGRAPVLPPLRTAPHPSALETSATPAAELVLLGTGTVGDALLRRLAERAAQGAMSALCLHAVCNSRSRYVAHADGWRGCGDTPQASARVHALEARLQSLPLAAIRARSADGRKRADTQIDTTRDARIQAPHGDTDADFALDAWCAPRTEAVERREGPRILIDATASDAVAERHAQWLAQGVHVVTACKLGQGGTLARWAAIRDAQRIGGTQYGDSATVGAGLPLLAAIRSLRAGGDRIHAIAGGLSGSLAWLFHAYDGLRPFSGFVRAAREAGYTEPDPREDLAGDDVRRKLLILARAAGAALEPEDVVVESLVPPALAALPASAVDAALPQLDASLRARFAEARRNGECLRFLARLELPADGPPRARVGLESLAPDHPLAAGAGTDNRVAIHSDRYRERPLLIQGPGAGADVTAAALIDDALAAALLAHRPIPRRD